MSEDHNNLDDIQGPTITASRIPWIDPTPNVIAQFKAEAKRQDDLREAADQLFQARQECTKEIINLRADFQRTLDAIRDMYTKQLSEAEAKRIDAIRAVDVNAVSTASTRAQESANVLAAQVTQSAETLRNLVATTAAASQSTFQQVTTQLSTRITALEQSSYQSAGKQAFADPQMVELLEEVKRLREVSSGAHGKSEGISASWGVFAGAAVIALALIFGMFQMTTHSVNYTVSPATTTR